MLWQDGTAASIYNVSKPGTYFLEATNTCGTIRDEILFTQGLCKIYIPTAFTPNADQFNNEFKVSGTSLVTTFHLQIFKRFGKLVFETTDKNKGWDGYYKSTPSDPVAYVYILQFKDFLSAQMQLIRGSFILFR